MAGRRLTITISFALIFVVLLSTVAIAASTNYTLESTSSIDTPPKTVTLQEDEYTVTSIGTVDVGGTLDVAVSRPGDQLFTIYLYSKDGEILDSVRRTENGTYPVETSSLDRGTYLIALDIGGDIKKIQPVVIDGYDFSVDAPSEVEADESVSITIELTGDTARPYYVDVAVMNDSVHRYTATHVEGRTYKVGINNLAPDDYRLYAGARGTEEVNGEDELLGVSAVQPLTVQGEAETTTTNPQTTTESTTTDESNGGGTGTDTGDSTTSTVTTTTPRTTNTPTNETTVPDNTTAEPPTTAANSTTGTRSTTERTSVVTSSANDTQATTTTNETTASTPIQPGTMSSTDSTSTEVPGFTAVTTILAVIASLLLGKRRQ